MGRKPKGEPTRLNLWVLAEFFKDADERPAKVAPTEYAHLKRCFNAGLCEVVGGVIRLTEAGKAALEAANPPCRREEESEKARNYEGGV